MGHSKDYKNEAVPIPPNVTISVAITNKTNKAKRIFCNLSQVTTFLVESDHHHYMTHSF